MASRNSAAKTTSSTMCCVDGGNEPNSSKVMPEKISKSPFSKNFCPHKGVKAFSKPGAASDREFWTSRCNRSNASFGAGESRRAFSSRAISNGFCPSDSLITDATVSTKDVAASVVTFGMPIVCLIFG